MGICGARCDCQSSLEDIASTNWPNTFGHKKIDQCLACNNGNNQPVGSAYTSHSERQEAVWTQG